MKRSFVGDPSCRHLGGYSTWNCPVCRNSTTFCVTTSVRSIREGARVFKDFPIEQLHPGQETAAIAAVALSENPTAFWKMYNFIYDNQEIISARTLDEEAGLRGSLVAADTFKSCMAVRRRARPITPAGPNGQLLDVNTRRQSREWGASWARMPAFSSSTSTTNSTN